MQVHGGLFNTPSFKKKQGLKKQAAAKLHVVWSVCNEWVEDFRVTGGRKNDSPISRVF